jgi:oligoendopeptidase F
MSSTAPSTKSGIPARSDIDPRYTWNLTDLYPSDEAWEQEYGEVKNLIENAGRFAGKLSDARTLYECLVTRTEVSRKMNLLYLYAFLAKELDNRVSKYQAMNEQAAMLGSQAGAAFAYVEPELVQIPDDKLREMAGKFERTDVYDFYIEDLIRSKKHIRSTEIEELLAQSALMARGASSAFNLLNDADLQYGTIKDEKGNEVTLTKQRFAKFMDSKDRRVRSDAYHQFYKAYQEHINTVGATLGASVNKDVFYTTARRFDNCLHAALDGDNIPRAVYDSLIETTESDLSALHKYTEVRKRVLKLDEINAWDMACPLFPEADYEVAYDEAVKTIMTALQPLGEDYCRQLADGFGSRWVDVFETEGKGSGAFSTGAYGVHPYVLMNYNDTVDNMFTLAHEMGHAMHSHFSSQKQPYPKAHYSIFVAEVASTLNEGLLMQHLLKKAEDDKTKLYLLNRWIDNTWGTFFYQTLLAHFELAIHEFVESGQALSPESLSKTYGELVQKYYGPAFSMDDYSHIKWGRIPHFYSAFYVYQYATSYAASQAILQKFLDGEQGIVDKYLELISSGGNDYPINQLKKCGVDMTTGEAVKATLALFSEQVGQMDELTR